MVSAGPARAPPGARKATPPPAGGPLSVE